ncbi:hypothetical protein DCS_02316 [Drechmeria coniospora]|uniref:Uncharacterized protein n=1 Tax=Drechmeria coniospora TaxID=98403 RepID=A0A151GVN2_DRECN|nr:hypothetical protein DCS_02316 [Drechmeria coniospora]KYK61175.1 hypothetical protein DCS_02316 [Drechmeria coniospora]ODA80940.1 hypothetical protein RJ55_03900 [Drechmeria coniospora]
MPPPQTRARHIAAQQARSRFQEGSMNDRTSAAPPVAFLDPTERAALERPVFADAQDAAPDAFASGQNGVAERSEQPMPPPPPAGRRMALLGQMWEGVRGRLRLRRGGPAVNAADGGENETKELGGEVKPAADERMSREEVLANYHQLVASGFFSSHTIYSTRHPGTRPGTSHTPHRPQSPHHPHHSHSHDDNHHSQPGQQTLRRERRLEPPQWPLAPTPSTPSMSLPYPEPICSPVSVASSRGTKRAADDDDDDYDYRGYDDDASKILPANEDPSTLAHRFLPKRLRRSNSRDISLPRLRAMPPPGRAIASMRRSIPMAAPMLADASGREPANATKRIPGGSFPNVGFLTAAPSPPESFDGPSPRLPAAAPSFLLAQGTVDGPFVGCRSPPPPLRRGAARRLRDRHQPLSVVPDAQRGIPTVPSIPVKFTYGHDRENDGPWRGLRR